MQAKSDWKNNTIQRQQWNPAVKPETQGKCKHCFINPSKEILTLKCWKTKTKKKTQTHTHIYTEGSENIGWQAGVKAGNPGWLRAWWPAWPYRFLATSNKVIHPRNRKHTETLHGLGQPHPGCPRRAATSSSGPRSSPGGNLIQWAKILPGRQPHPGGLLPRGALRPRAPPPRIYTASLHIILSSTYIPLCSLKEDILLIVWRFFATLAFFGWASGPVEKIEWCDCSLSSKRVKGKD